jgi:integrase
MSTNETIIDATIIDERHDEHDVESIEQAPAVALVVRAPERSALSAEHAAQAKQAHEAADMFARAAMSENTRAQYEKEARYFVAWVQATGLPMLDAGTARAYLAHLATTGGRKAAGINVARAALVKAFEIMGGPNLSDDPAIRATMRGIRSALAIERPQTQAKGIDAETLRAMVETLPGAYAVLGAHAGTILAGIEHYAGKTSFAQYEQALNSFGVTSDLLVWALTRYENDRLRFLRDRALLLVSFAMAARRSEVTGKRGIRAEDISFNAKGCTIRIRVSKTDQSGKGTTKGIHFAQDPEACPVRALRAWLDAAGIKKGFVFVSVQEFDRASTLQERAAQGKAKPLSHCRAVQVIKESYERATGESAEGISGHSMRRGAATAVAERTGDVLQVRRVTGHKSTAMASRYVEDADVMRSNPLAGIL